MTPAKPNLTFFVEVELEPLEELFAQPEVTRAVRAKPNFLQRISTTFTFSPLSEAEASRLITHRLQMAGLKRGDVFSKGAIKEIANYAGGIPRVLVTCCRNAMITAARARERRVSEEAVQFAIASTWRLVHRSEPVPQP